MKYVLGTAYKALHKIPSGSCHCSEFFIRRCPSPGPGAECIKQGLISSLDESFCYTQIFIDLFYISFTEFVSFILCFDGLSLALSL